MVIGKSPISIAVLASILIGILLFTSVATGSSVVTSSTGKFIVKPWETQTDKLPFLSDKEMCGTCLASPSDTFASVASSDTPLKFQYNTGLASDDIFRIWYKSTP
jgi:hypothetical protein